MNTDTLSMTEAARQSGISREWLLKLAHQGLIAGAYRLDVAINKHRPWRIPVESLNNIERPPRGRKRAAQPKQAVESRKPGPHPLSPAEHDRAHTLWCEQLDICERRRIEPPQTWDEALTEWESIPQATRQEMLWPEPAEARPLYTARYRAYETPRRDWLV